jgi:hypothetical protein
MDNLIRRERSGGLWFQDSPGKKLVKHHLNRKGSTELLVHGDRFFLRRLTFSYYCFLLFCTDNALLLPALGMDSLFFPDLVHTICSLLWQVFPS